MGSRIEYVESSHIHATNYVRNSKAIAVLWGIFTICYAIIAVVAFVTPEWIGDTIQSKYPARFGLWVSCSFRSANEVNNVAEDCVGRLDDFSSIPSIASRASVIFVGIAVILSIVVILCMILFFFLRSTKVFHICGWLQVFSALCMIIGIVGYPAGWDSLEVRRTCGTSAGKYELGECSLRWAYLLAIIGCLDAIILSALAFILATRHVKLQADPGYGGNGSLYKGELNSGFINDSQSIAGSRKSLNMHPVLLMTQPHDVDRFSEFSNRTGRSKTSAYRGDYASSVQNFQL